MNDLMTLGSDMNTLSNGITATEHFLSQYSPATARVNEQVLREAISFIGKPLTEATQEDVIRYQGHIRNSANNTQKRKLATLSAAFKYLMKRKVMAENPMEAIRLPKTDRLRTVKWLQQDEVDTLVSSLRDRQTSAIIHAGLSGLRVSEIASLNVDQVRDGRLWLVQGKGGKVRTVPLTSQAAEALEEWAQERMSGPLFSLRGGRRITARSIQNVVSEATTKALGRRVNPHALRHTFGTLGAKAGIPVLHLARVMGHANLDVTNIYVHLDDEDLLEQVRKLDKPLSTAKGKLRLVYSKAG